MTYFRRATVLLALGRSKTALNDLNKVVELRPDFHRVIITFAVFDLFHGFKAKLFHPLYIYSRS